jgi:diguanylate cyclase (GGDEF)-like protein
VEQQVGRDSLTGLLDHQASWIALRHEHAGARRLGLPLTLILIDLAHFKKVNDTIGHLNGDQLLCRIAQLLSQNVRARDIVGRVGGDEFVVILPGAREPAGHQLMRRVESHIMPMRRDGVVPEDFAISYGRATGADTTAEEMFRQAEAQLYSLRGRKLVRGNAPVDLPRLRVLVIGGKADLATRAQDVLSARGYSVACATTLGAARRWIDSSSPDVIVTEQELADGSARDLEESLAQPVIVVGGDEGAFARHLREPYSTDDLVRAVDEAVAELEGI